MRARAPDDPRSSLPSAREGVLDRILRWGVLAVVVVGLAWSIPHWPNAWRWLTGREPLYIPAHPVNLDDVETRAQQLEREQFGHGVPITLGDDFPERLPVTWARDKRPDVEASDVP